jgi:hypothetical protein
VLRALYASGLAKTREYEALRVETRACGDLLLERVDSTHFYSQFHVAAVYAPLWESGADAVLARYRSVLNEPFDGDLHRIYFLRYLFANVRDGTQDLGTDPSKMPWLLGDAAKWTEFVQSLRNSPRLQDRLDAWLIDFCSADAAARQEIGRKIEAALWAARDEIFRGRITTGQLLAILRSVKPAPEFRARMLEQYFASDAPFSESMLSACVDDDFQDEAAARRLLAAAISYRERTDRAHRWEALSDVGEITQFEQRLREKFPALATATVTAKAALRIAPPFDLTKQPGFENATIQKVVTRGEKAWFLFWENKRSELEIAECDIPNRKVLFRVGIQTHSSKGRQAWSVDGDSRWLAVAEPGWVNVLDRQTGTWKFTPVPSGPEPLVRVIGSRIYYAFPGPGTLRSEVTESGILEIDPISARVEILGSSRRKEGEPLLNNVEPYLVLSLTALSDGRVLASICSDCLKIYNKKARLLAYDPRERSWQNLYPELIQDWKRAVITEYLGGLLLQPVDVWKEAFLWENGQFPRSVLSQQRPQTLQTYDSASVAGTINLANGSRGTQNGKDFWFLDSGHPQRTLYHFASADAEPQAIPLEFESANAEQEGAPTSCSLTATASGLILTGNEDVWLIPYRDLEEYLAAHSSGS